MRAVSVGLGASREGQIGRGHSAPITCLEWSPDGKRLATGSYDGSVKLWSAAGMQLERTLLHMRLVNGVRWSPDGRLLATASADKTCVVWDVANGNPQAVFARHGDDVNAIAWSPDGRLLATVSEDATGRLWSLADQRLLDPLLSHHSHCMSVDWSRVGGHLATCGEDATVRLWDSEGHPTATIPHPGDLEQCRWSPDGTRLASACDDGVARIFSADGECVAELGPHDGPSKSVTWSPEGRRLAVGSYDARCTVWDIRSRTKLRVIEGPTLWPRALHWHPQRDLLAVGTFDAEPAIFDLADSSVAINVRKPTHGINAITTVAELGLLLALDDGTVRLWEPAHNGIQTVSAASLPGSLVNTVAHQPARNLIAYGTFDGQVYVHPLRDSVDLAQVTIGAPVNQVAFSPDGRHLVAVDYEGRAIVIGVAAGPAAVEKTLQLHTGAIKSCAWIDDGHFVTGSTDRRIKVVGIDGSEMRVFEGHANLINSVDVSGPGPRRYIASASRDKTVRIWDMDATSVAVLLGHDESVKVVRWRPGSTTQLMSGSYDFDVRLWDLAIDEVAAERSVVLTGHRNGVGALEWWGADPVSAAWDTSVIIWDAANRRPRTFVVLSEALA